MTQEELMARLNKVHFDLRALEYQMQKMTKLSIEQHIRHTDDVLVGIINDIEFDGGVK